jgi:hypothetical protein
VEATRVVSDTSVDVEITDETSNELLDRFLKSVSEAALQENVKLSPADIRGIRRRLLMVDRLKFSNEFVVNVFDKSIARKIPVKLSLASLFVLAAPALGLNVDHLVANEQSILTGVSVVLNNAKVNGQKKDFQVNRWVLFVENKERYFQVEIAYSPQVDPSIKIWEELRRVLSSFKVIGA